jgi:HlyD family secretion protein
MDRTLPGHIIRNRRIRQWILIIGAVGGLAAVTFFVHNITVTRVHLNQITSSQAERSDMVVTFSATGRVVPVYEEVLISPLSSRIIKILCQPGQEVEKGEKILEIDVANQQFELARLQSQFDQINNNHSRLSLDILRKEENANLQHDLLQRRIETLTVELEHEQYLQSIGGSPPERVAKLQMDLETARLEFESSQKQLSYSRQITRLELQSLQIDLNIHRNRLDEMKAVLQRAQMLSPIAGTLSFLPDQAGVSIGAGEVAARISDLSAYRVEAVVGDSYSSRLLAGQQVMVRVGREELQGWVAHVAPSVKDGVLNFGITLSEASHQSLRPNMRVDTRVVSQQISNALCIRVGEFYSGPGQYDLFVINNNQAFKRRVTLGGASFTHIEVINGLNEGETVITSNMKNFEKLEKIGVRN